MSYFPTQFPLILASGSSIRRTLLRQAGINATSRSVDVDEAFLRQEAEKNALSPAQTALSLARAKAEKAAHDFPPQALIIAADQILDCHGTIFSKPSSRHHAKQQLQQLRGRTHSLHSAVVLWQGDRCLWEHVSSPHLTMRNFSDRFLDQYLALDGEEILYCVGGYRLEGIGIQLFEEYEGTYDAILGLPLLPLLEALRCHGGLKT